MKSAPNPLRGRTAREDGGARARRREARRARVAILKTAVQAAAEKAAKKAQAELAAVDVSDAIAQIRARLDPREEISQGSAGEVISTVLEAQNPIYADLRKSSSHGAQQYR